MNANFRQDLETLAGAGAKWCVSLYLPTHRTGTDTRQDPIRLKNLIGQAEERLTQLGLRGPEAADLLSPARALLDDAVFWGYQDQGLAIFLAPGVSRQLRLPVPVEEAAVVAERFHLKPLLPLISGNGILNVLALSRRKVRLLRGTRHAVSETEIEEVPGTLADYLLEEPEKSLQFHTGTAPPAPSTGARRQAMYHGQGVGKDEEKDRVLRFFRLINEKVVDELGPENPAPLVLAGVGDNFPLYREANTYPRLFDEGVPGSPEGKRAEELMEQARQVIGPQLRDEVRDVKGRYGQFRDGGRGSSDVREVALAAANKRIDSLFVAEPAECWGTVDVRKQEVEQHDRQRPGDQDLLDFAAVQTYINGGRVYPVKRDEVPDGGLLAAFYRW